MRRRCSRVTYLRGNRLPKMPREFHFPFQPPSNRHRHHSTPGGISIPRLFTADLTKPQRNTGSRLRIDAREQCRGGTMSGHAGSHPLGQAAPGLCARCREFTGFIPVQCTGGRRNRLRSKSFPHFRALLINAAWQTAFLARNSSAWCTRSASSGGNRNLPTSSTIPVPPTEYQSRTPNLNYLNA